MGVADLGLFAVSLGSSSAIKPGTAAITKTISKAAKAKSFCKS
jgi:hypothetical protein